MDAAENRRKSGATGVGVGPPGSNPGVAKQAAARRHTVSGPGDRPNNLPMQMGPSTEPIPVPTQKAAYQQIQASLVRSRSRSGDSVSAMSGISSASGGSTLGPLPEDRLAGFVPEQSPGGVRKHARVSPLASPKSPAAARHLTATRRISAPPLTNVPDICQLSPPNVQFILGGTPPTTTTGFSHRRRTSSSSSCGKFLGIKGNISSFRRKKLTKIREMSRSYLAICIIERPNSLILKLQKVVYKVRKHLKFNLGLLNPNWHDL